ncbi:MAG: replication initiation factor domain-containing protein, partial [Clostridia bacterium]|nr:replication initiation factor domain-containing protein [Clostridia bacterium]
MRFSGIWGLLGSRAAKRNKIPLPVTTDSGILYELCNQTFSRIYHGSPKSNMYIRIYDKAAERDLEGIHWIRVEMQMRDEIA